MTKLNLPTDILSQQDLMALIKEIQQYSKWFGQTSVKMRVNKTKIADQPEVSEPVAQLLNEWAGNEQLTQKQLDGLINALVDYEADAPRLTITLAAPAPNKLKKSLIKWCRDNVDPDVLVNFKFNATILGGMVVTYGSHIYDWSFRRQILAARQKFPEVLRNV